MDQKCTNDIRYNKVVDSKDLNENLAWLNQKTEDPKSNKENLTFLLHTVNVIELNCKIIKKVATPPPFSGLSPPF